MRGCRFCGKMPLEMKMVRQLPLYRCSDRACVGYSLICKAGEWNAPVHLGVDRSMVASIISGAIGLSGTVKPEKQAEDAIKALIKCGIIEV